MAARQLGGILIKRMRCGQVAVSEQLVQRQRRRTRGNQLVTGERIELTRKSEDSGQPCVVQWFLAEAVAGEVELSALDIEHSEGKHTAQPLRQAGAPFHITVYQDFSVRVAGRKDVSRPCQLCSQFLVVVDFAIVDHTNS